MANPARGRDSLSDEIAALRSRLNRLERRGPQLAYSSVEDGAITWNDADGTPTMVVGAQPDGTSAPTVVSGPVPPGATGVTVEQGVNSIICGWFGTFMEDVAAPLDYARAEFHISTDGPSFVPDVVGLGDPSTTLLATLESPRGGRAVVTGLPYEPHWVKVVIRSLSGKFSTASTSVFITPKQVNVEDIAFGAVTADSLAVGAVTAEKLDVQVLQAGMTVTGRIQVGASYWTPTELVFPQPDGTFTRFSANGSGINEISGNIRAKSLTVEQNLNILGATNKISGTLEASSGVTPPDNPPTVSATWNTQGAHDTTAFGPINYGACEKIGDPNLMVTPSSFFGAGINILEIATGVDKTAFYDTTGVPGWGGSWSGGTDFRPYGGIVATATHYFVLGQDMARGGSWYIYKLSPTDFSKVAEAGFAAPGAFSSRPTLGYDGTSLIVAWVSTGGTAVSYTDMNPTTLAAGASGSIPWPGINSSTNLFHVSRGVYDFTDSKVRYFIGFENLSVGTYDLATGGGFEGGQYSWAAPFGETLRGMWYSPSRARWMTDSTAGKIVILSPLRVNTVINAEYTWYDSVGTVRETTPSPTGTYTVPARARIVIQTDTPPDSGVTDPGLVDKANRVGIYAAIGAATIKLQQYLPVDGVTGISTKVLILDAITTSGAAVPSSNTFVGGTSSPGSVRSAASDANGKIWRLEGSGSARIGQHLWSTAGIRTDARYWLAGPSSYPLFNAASWVAVPGCSLTVPVASTAEVFKVSITADVACDTLGSITIANHVDGTLSGVGVIGDNFAVNQRITMSQTGIIVTGLSVGNHTFSLQAIVSPGAYYLYGGTTILVERI